MSVRHLVHPQSLQIYDNPRFLDEPQPELTCLYCSLPCDRQAPVPQAMVEQDGANPLVSETGLKEAGLTRDSTKIFRCRKWYCDEHCVVKVVEHKPEKALVSRVLVEVYGITGYIRQALPFWVQTKFGGVVTPDEFVAWKKRGLPAIRHHLRSLTDGDVAIDNLGGVVGRYNGPGDEVSEARLYRFVSLQLMARNPWHDFEFDDQDPRWTRLWTKRDNLCCFNDFHPIVGPAFTGVVDIHPDEPTKRRCHGAYCSPGCYNAVNVRAKGHLWKRRLAWNTDFHSTYWFGGRPLQPWRCGSRRLLRIFMGSQSIEEFRSMVSGVHRIILEPPFCSWRFDAERSDDAGGHHVIEPKRVTWSFTGTPIPRDPNLVNPYTLQYDPHVATRRFCHERYHRVSNRSRVAEPGPPLHYAIHVELMVIEQPHAIASYTDVLLDVIQSSSKKRKLSMANPVALPPPRTTNAATATTR